MLVLFFFVFPLLSAIPRNYTDLTTEELINVLLVDTILHQDDFEIPDDINVFICTTAQSAEKWEQMEKRNESMILDESITRVGDLCRNATEISGSMVFEGFDISFTIYCGCDKLNKYWNTVHVFVLIVITLFLVFFICFCTILIIPQPKQIAALEKQITSLTINV
ncbi:unnamed protein product [Caenorhabditis angaria]|uniref:Uncharacterized protein n=1 Tax=Caenorhabditis angaria TaxID=860376 RepID=A0A9P1J536_9PELO|nr:unnamed protein product [Caenorhabditis angaria]